MAEARYQLLDGPEELRGCYGAEALATLARSRGLPPWVRVIDVQSLQTMQLGDLVPGLSAPEAETHAPLPLELPSRAPAAAASSQATAPAARAGSDAAIQAGTTWQDLEFSGILGQGGMGTVHRGIWHRPGQDPLPVAIKLLPGTAESDPDAVKRFEREAALLAQVQSPHVVRIHKSGIYQSPQGPRHVIVMELVPGRSLRAVLDQRHQPSIAEAAQWIIQVAQALWATAKQGLVHRDVKPGNILFNGDGSVKLGDFGIARAVASASTQLTATGAVLGTATYMSPEQAQGGEADHRSDIYALGVVLYEMLAGHPPFRAESIASLLLQHCEDEPAELPRNVPQEMSEIVRRCLAKDPQNRYQSAMDLARDLKELLRRDSAPARPTARPSALPVQQGGGGGGGVLLAVGAVLLLAAAGAGGWWLWQNRDNSAPAKESGTAAVPGGKPTTTVESPETPRTTTTTKPPKQPAQPIEDAFSRSWSAYRTAVTAERWAEAHAAALACLNEDDGRGLRDGIKLPVLIGSAPTGAVVLQGDHKLGVTPLLLQLAPGATMDLLLRLDQHGPQRLAVDGRTHHVTTTLTRISGLAWTTVLAETPHRSLATVNRVVLHDGSGLAAVQGRDGRVVRLPTLAEELGQQPVLSAHGQHCHAIGVHDLFAIDAGTTQLLWRVEADLIDEHACYGPHVAVHELVAGQHKAYIANGARLLSFLLPGGRAIPLAPTPLSGVATAAPAVVAVDTALSTLVQPVGSRLYAFNGASVIDTAPLEPLFSIDVGSTVTQEPLPLWHEGVPCFAVLAEGGAGYLYDARAGVARSARIRTNWHLGRSARWPAQRLGDSGKLLIGLVDHRVACVDLDQQGATCWELPAATAGLVGAPLLLGDTMVLLDAAGELSAVSATDGSPRWRINLGAAMTAGPWHCEGRLVVLMTGGTVLGIEPPGATEP